MKNFILLSMTLCMLLFAACNSNTENNEEQTQQAEESTKGTMSLDLNQYNLPLVMLVPDSTIAPLEINEQSWGALEIKVGKYFQIQIIEEGLGIEQIKNDLKSDNMFNNTIIEEQTNAIIYKQEKEGLESRYHFYMILQFEGINYEVQDIKMAPDPFSEKVIRKMFETVKQIKSSRSSV